MRLITYHILLRSVKNKQKHKWVTYSAANSFHRSTGPRWMIGGLQASMYGWCSCLIHGVHSTKSHPVFSHKPDSSSSSSPSIPLSCLSLHLHQPPFSPAIQLLLSPGQQAIQKAVAEQRQAVSCQLSERERGRERETFQSVNKALLLPSNQSWPPPPSNILPLFAEKKQAGREKYTVRGQL